MNTLACTWSIAIRGHHSFDVMGDATNYNCARPSGATTPAALDFVTRDYWKPQVVLDKANGLGLCN